MSLITSQLYLGDAYDAQNMDFIRTKNITLIVNCAKEVPNYLSYKPNLKYIRLELDDLPSENIQPALELAANEIINTIYNKENVFVHCAAGISRSASVVIYTLIKLYNWDYDKAYDYVKTLRPIINPNYGFIYQVRQMQNEYFKILKNY